jgi:hypothetical protein
MHSAGARSRWSQGRGEDEEECAHS